MVEEPTEVNKDIHQFIHSFTKHSRRIDSMLHPIDTERNPKELWGRGKEADPCAGRRARALPWRLCQPTALPGVSR